MLTHRVDRPERDTHGTHDRNCGVYVVDREYTKRHHREKVVVKQALSGTMELLFGGFLLARPNGTENPFCKLNESTRVSNRNAP